MNLFEGVVERQRRFWTAKTTGASAGLFRIAIGLLSTWTAVGVGLNLRRYYQEDGLLPYGLVNSGRAFLNLLAIAPRSDGWVTLVFALFLASSITLALGAWSRASAAVAWVTALAFQIRNPWVLNGGDRLFVIVLALAILMPTSRRFSLDAWWRARRGLPPPPEPSIWSLRLMQVQIAWVYFVTGTIRISHARWRAGTQMRDVLDSVVFSEWPVHIDSRIVIAVLTYAVLAFECGFPIAVWNDASRKLWLLGGVVFHVGIEILMVIPMFSWIMLAGYVAFVTDDEAERFVAWLRGLPARFSRPTITTRAEEPQGDG